MPDIRSDDKGLEVQSPEVTVISVFYNRAYCVEDSVGSLRSQTYRNCRVRLIDDGSTDDTNFALSNVSGGQVSVERHENIGFTASLRKEIARSDSKYIAIHGAGDISMPTRIAEQAAFLERTPACVAVGCGRETVSMNRQETRRFVPENLVTIRRNSFIDQLFTVLVHGDVMFRRDVYDDVGGYREVFRFAQDYDLWLRMNEQGEICILPKMLYREVSRTDGVRGDPQKVLLQRYLMEFARQCHAMRHANIGDPIERFGTHGLLLREPSQRLGSLLARAGSRYLLQDDWQAARIFLEASRREKLTVSRIVLELFMARLLPANEVRALWRWLTTSFGRRNLPLPSDSLRDWR